MVNDLANRLTLNFYSVLLAEVEAPVRKWEGLTPVNQLRVIMGLFVVVILGIFLFLVIKAGSHMVKGLSAPANRLRSNRLRSNSTPQEDDWAQKPLNELPGDVDKSG